LALENIVLGKKLKAFRKDAGMSLSEVAGQAGLSSAFISMVENGKSGISYTRLHVLLRIYNRNLIELDETDRSDGSVVKAGNACTVVTDNHTILQAMSSINNEEYIGGFRMFIEPGYHNSFDQHVGHEFTYVIHGDIQVVLRHPDGTEERRDLTTGDTTIHDSMLKHSWYNVGDDVATVLIIEIKNQHQDESCADRYERLAKENDV
jgi:Predicted transcriptional regulators